MLENAYSCPRNLGPPRKSGPTFTKIAYLLRTNTPNHANFIAVGQMVYEKSVTLFTPFAILARPPLSSCEISSPPDDACTRYLQPEFVDFVDGVTDTHTNSQNLECGPMRNVMAALGI